MSIKRVDSYSRLTYSCSVQESILQDRNLWKKAVELSFYIWHTGNEDDLTVEVIWCVLGVNP